MGGKRTLIAARRASTERKTALAGAMFNVPFERSSIVASSEGRVSPRPSSSGDGSLAIVVVRGGREATVRRTAREGIPGGR